MVFFRKLAIASAALALAISAFPSAAFSAPRSDSFESVTQENLFDVLKMTYDAGSVYSGYIKFSLELDAAGAPVRAYFQADRFAFHADFLRTLPAYRGMGPAEIDAIALRTQGRRLLLGSVFLVDSEGGGLTGHGPLHFEFLSRDPLTPVEVRRAFDFVEARVRAILTEASYLPAPEQRAYVSENGAAFVAAGIRIAVPPAANRDACYAGGWTAGYVKKIRAADLPAAIAAGEIGRSDVLVMDEAPRDLPPYGALLVASPSSPSSHAALLAEMSGSPFLFVPGIFESEKWSALAARRAPVLLKVIHNAISSCNWQMEEGERLGPGAFARLVELKRPVTIAQEPFLAGDVSPIDLGTGEVPPVGRAGAKAMNVARLMRWVPEATVTKAIAVPIAAFAAHLDSGVTSDGRPLGAYVVAERDALARPGVPFGEVHAGLARIREAIERSRIDAALASALVARYEASFPRASRVRLRSSSNAEDNPQFNGAGLYESYGACIGDDSLPPEATASLCNPRKKPDSVLGAIRKVWASLYTEKAFLLRAHFGIAEANVGMGVLSHPSFPGEAANGVMIVRKEKTWRGEEYVVQSTGFPGEELSVTNPPVGKVPETVRITSEEIEAVVRSTEVSPSRLLLDQAQYRELHRIAGVVHAKFESEVTGAADDGIVLDLEWKLLREAAGDRILVKQVRPVPVPAYAADAAALGTVLPGAARLKLCPGVAERVDALDRLVAGRPALVDIAFHAIPATNALPATIPNPLLKAELELLDGAAVAQILPEATLEATEWEAVGSGNGMPEENGTERRMVTVRAPVRVRGFAEPYYLSWGVEQNRKQGQAIVLEGLTVEPFGGRGITIATNAFGSDLNWGMWAASAEVAACELEAVQGVSPAFIAGSFERAYSEQREPPVEDRTVFTGGEFRIELVGRTSMQGFDKTMFLHVDRVVLRGLLPRELTIERAHAAVYAPAHHNFAFAWAIDPYAANGFTAAERESLASRGIRLLLLRQSGFSHDPDSTEGIPRLIAVGADGSHRPLADLAIEERAPN